MRQRCGAGSECESTNKINETLITVTAKFWEIIGNLAQASHESRFKSPTQSYMCKRAHTHTQLSSIELMSFRLSVPSIATKMKCSMFNSIHPSMLHGMWEANNSFLTHSHTDHLCLCEITVTEWLLGFVKSRRLSSNLQFSLTSSKPIIFFSDFDCANWMTFDIFLFHCIRFSCLTHVPYVGCEYGWKRNNVFIQIRSKGAMNFKNSIHSPWHVPRCHISNLCHAASCSISCTRCAH